MKNIICTFACIAFTYFGYGQAYSNSLNNHEVKFNIGHFLLTTTVESSYEYYLNEDASIGATLYFNGDATDYNGSFGFGPNLRAYFGFDPKSGLFAEVFGLYYTGEDKDSTQNNVYKTTALGVGAGTKLATRSQKFTIEVNGGIGRNINPKSFQSAFMFRAALSVGFRL